LFRQYMPPSYVPTKTESSDMHGEDERILPFNFDFHLSDPSVSTE
jgi:hypothetical protein